MKSADDLGDGPELLRRFRHLVPAQRDPPVVHPEIDEALAARTLALRDFVFVMRKDEILAAAVQIERGPAVLHAHRRALDVPARAAGAPGARPGGLARLRRLPQREIERVVLAFVDFHSRAGTVVVDAFL